MNAPLSNCCHAEMKVEGNTTHYYVCTKCNKSCDMASDNKEFSGYMSENPKGYSEREKLIEELNLIVFGSVDEAKERIADFILEYRKRVVEPLVKHKKLWCGNWKEYTANEAIDETLRNSGITEV